MTTNFPTSVDAFTNPTSNDTLDNPPHDQQHADINDAMEAVQTSLLDGSPLKIDDANNRVGIGTVSPARSLHVEGTGGTYIAVTTDSTGFSGILFGDDVQEYQGGVIYSAADDSLFLRSHNNITRMTIDSSGNTSLTGYLAHPRAFFRAYKGGNTGWSLTGAQAVVFDNTTFNSGNNYSTTTGRFTAPVAGYYHFGAHFFKYTTYTNSTNTYWGIFTSNGYSTTTNHGTQGQDGGQSLSCIVYMGQNDYADVQITSSGSTIQSYGTMGFNSFYGYLLSA